MMEVQHLASRPEVDLLLCCARTVLNPRKAEKVRALLRSKMDWPYLLQMAGIHGLIPLLYSNLKKAFSDLIPAAVLDQLHNQFLANAGRNLFLTEELFQLLHLFETNGILAIPLKGPALAATVYRDLALRTFSDLDIVVHRGDIQKAKALLISRGYRLDISLSPQQETAFLQSESEGWFVHPAGRVLVELQWGEPRDFPVTLDFEPLWDRLGQASIAGRTIMTFSPEDLLIILSWHGALHCWERLGWVCDLAESIRVHPQMDWKGLMERTKRLGCRRVLLVGLILAREVLEATFPEDYWETICLDPSSVSLAHRVREKLFHDAPDPLGTLGRSLFYLKLTERRRDRTAYILRSAFKPTVVDWQAFPLPVPLFFLYYLIHPIRVAGKYGWPFFRHPFRQ